MYNKSELIKKNKFIILIIGCFLVLFHQPTFAINPIDQSLFSAVSKGSVQEVEQAIHNGADVNSTDKNGNLILALAVQHGNFHIVQLLLEKGSKIDTVLLADKRNTLLHLAAQNGYVEIARLLLRKKNNMIYHANADKETPLHLAAANGHTETVKLLLEKGADIQALDSCNQTALHLAAENGHTETVKLLLEKGAKIEAVNKVIFDYNGQTPLHLAAWNGHAETVKLLLEKGANIKALDNDNQTPLHLAAKDGRIYTVELLLERGAQTHVLNLENKTPLDYAFSSSIFRDRPSGRISGIDITRMNMFIRLFLWHNYQASTVRINYYETLVYQSIKNLIKQIEAINPSHLHTDEAEYFEQAEFLIRWLFHNTSNCESTKGFLAKILQHLLEESNHPEQQNLLKENIKDLLLNNYLLNKENSDFYNLKSTFSSIQLKKLKELENFLREIYAKQLRKELFNNDYKRNLENKLNDLKKEEGDLSVLGKIRSLHKINNPVIHYCNNTSIETPFKNNILKIHEAVRMYSFLEWIQSIRQQHASSLESSLQEEPTRKKLKANDCNSAKKIWSNCGTSYLEDSKQLLIDSYHHLDHIINQEGSQINSDTRFGRNKIDILKFEKEETHTFDTPEYKKIFQLQDQINSRE